MNAMTYYAILHPGETLEDCFRVCRDIEAGFEKYDLKENKWKYDEELWGVFWGSPEVEKITEVQAYEIIGRVRMRIESTKISDNCT